MAAVNLKAPTEVTAKHLVKLITKSDSRVLLNPHGSGQIYRITRFDLAAKDGQITVSTVLSGFSQGVTAYISRNGAETGQLAAWLLSLSSTDNLLVHSKNFDIVGYTYIYLEEGNSIEIVFRDDAAAEASLEVAINYEVIGAPTPVAP
jgi:hypothetical protein